MPRFFFDLAVNETSTTDLDGLDLVSLDLARAEALTTLAEIAREARTIGDTRQLVCTVRNDHGPLDRLELTMRRVPLH